MKAIVRLAGISAVDFDEGAFAAAMSVILNLPAAKISVIAYSSVTISRHLAAEAVEVQFEVEIDGDTDTVADAIVQMLESDNLGASFAAERPPWLHPRGRWPRYVVGGSSGGSSSSGTTSQ